MRTRALALLPFLLLLGLLLGVDRAGAAKVKSWHDPGYDFKKVKTWRFKPDRQHRNENLDGRIIQEIRKELAKKGLRELKDDSEEKPDVLVSFQVGTVDTISPGFVAVGDWYGTIWAVPGVDSAITGGVLIEMGDPESGKELWAASYVMKGNNANALQVMASRVEKAVRGALGKYPPR